MAAIKWTSTEQEEARVHLRDILTPSDTVYTILRHVSKSRMMRRISPVVFRHGEPRHLDCKASAVLGWPSEGAGEGLRIGGCGMDMGFELVYCLSRALWPDGFECIGDGCPANDHVNGDRDYTPHLHRDGGYALQHRWL